MLRVWVVLFCVFGFGVCQETVPCIFTNGTDSWDLTPLMYDYTAPAPAEYTMNANVLGYNAYFSINFCAPVSLVTMTHCHYIDFAGACESGVYDAGDVQSTKFIPYEANYQGDEAGGIGLRYSGGQPCSSVVRKTEIFVTCDPTVETLEMYSIKEPESCYYKVWVRSQFGCPGTTASPDKQCCMYYDQGDEIGTSFCQVSNFPTESCESCYEVQNICCLYQSGEFQTSLCTQPTSSCPNIGGYDLVGQYGVSDCTQCSIQ